MPSLNGRIYPAPALSIGDIRQFDLGSVSSADQEKELSCFRERLLEWERQMDSIQAGVPGTVSVEIPVFRGSWLIPCIESVLYQTSADWTLSMLWDGGDDLSRRILELIRDFDHPKLRVYFSPNRGIARAQNYLSRLTHGDGAAFIMAIDDDDMFAPAAVARLLAHAQSRPWVSVARARRLFIDEVGNPVDQEPWFPFEGRHFQFGMVTDIHNHSQPTIMNRAAYDRTAGWEGFEDFHHAGADCDIYLKMEEQGAVELLDDVLYFYRLHGARTSHQLGPAGAFEMWRRLADKAIQRRGLQIRRITEVPPFQFERAQCAGFSKDSVEVVIAQTAGCERGQAARTVKSLKRCGIPNEAIRVVVSENGLASARNRGFLSTTQPLVLFIDSGAEFSDSDAVERLAALMQERSVDLAGPQFLAEDGTVESAQTRFDARRRPFSVGRGDVNRDQYTRVVEVPWLPASVLCVRREVLLAAGPFDDQFLQAPASDVDFSLKARHKGFKCLYVGSVRVTHADFEGNFTMGLQLLHEKWRDSPELWHMDGAAPAAKQEQVSAAEGWEFHLNEGDRLFGEGRWESAAAEYQRAIDMQPDAPWPSNGLGNALSKMERPEDAVAAYRRTMELDPRHFPSSENLGHLLFRLGRWEEAVGAFRKAIEIDGNVASVYSGLADALAQLQRWQEAAESQRRSIEIEPNRAWSHNNLANALFQLEQWEDAGRAYARAVEIDPNFASAHHSRGDALGRQSLWSEAIRAYERAIELRPDFLWSYFNCASAHGTLKNWDEAASLYRRAIEIDPDSAPAYYNLGNCLSQTGNWQEAADAFARSLELDPSVYSARENCGHMLAMLGRWEDAAEAFRRAAETAPEQASAHHNLADILCRLERWEEAISSYRRAAQLDPNRAATYNGIGNAHFALKRWRAAMGAYQRALAIDPEFRDAPYSLANTLFKQGRWLEAIKAYDRAIEVQPDFPWSYFDRANTLFEQKKWEEAESGYRKAIELSHEIAAYHARLADVLVEQERWGAAEASYRRAIELRNDVLAWHDKLGKVLFRQERWEDAVTVCRQAIDAGMKSESLCFTWGSALVRMERWAEAVIAYQRAASLAPDVAVNHQYLGTVLLKVERWEDAAAAFQQALSLDEGISSAYHGLGDALAHLERWDDALRAYDVAIKLDPGYLWSHNNQANVLCSLGQWEAAADAYQRASDIHPSAGCFQNLGNALFNLERWEEAAAAYEKAIHLDSSLFWCHHNLALCLSHLERWEACIAPYMRAAELGSALSPRLYRNCGDALLKLERWKDAAEAYARAEALNPEWSRADAGPAAARMEDWINGLARVRKQAKGGRNRLLFVLDSDYGELTTVMYLLLGQDLRNEALLLLPPRLYVTNQESLPGKTRPYTSSGDILSVIDKEKPEIVFLCSAYLFSIHNILSLRELEQLVRQMKSKGCQVVTADPFLGTLAAADSSTVSIAIPENATEQLQKVKGEQDQRLIKHFSKSFEILKNLVHVYPAYTGPRGRRKQGMITEVKTASFFNRELLLPAKPARLPADKRHWFFMIASRDYETQAIFHGKDWFIKILVAKLEQAQRAGRHVVFIGPYDCVQTVIGALTVTKSITLLSFCSFPKFSSLLLTAEYAFYWNSLSHSMLLRLFNKAPVFQFDRGHLVRNVKPLYKRIVDCYYQGWEPIYLDQEQDLDVKKLDRLAAQYRAAAERVSASLQLAPSPTAMVAEIIGRDKKTEKAKASGSRTSASTERIESAVRRSAAKVQPA